jgi:hypothetical protein
VLGQIGHLGARSCCRWARNAAEKPVRFPDSFRRSAPVSSLQMNTRMPIGMRDTGALLWMGPTWQLEMRMSMVLSNEGDSCHGETGQMLDGSDAVTAAWLPPAGTWPLAPGPGRPSPPSPPDPSLCPPATGSLVELQVSSLHTQSFRCQALERMCRASWMTKPISLRRIDPNSPSPPS